MLTATAKSFAALSLTVIADPTFGRLLSGASNRQFILNTDDTVSGPDAADYIVGARAGELDVHETGTSASINIVVENITPTGGLSINEPLCRYHTDAQVACDGGGITVNSGSHRTLNIGLDISTSQAHSGGDSASITMDISINYI